MDGYKIHPAKFVPSKNLKAKRDTQTCRGMKSIEEREKAHAHAQAVVGANDDENWWKGIERARAD